MSEKEDRKEFVEPKLSKFEEPLDEVTMGFIGPYCGTDCAG
jgi:hypothetical protein